MGRRWRIGSAIIFHQLLDSQFTVTRTSRFLNNPPLSYHRRRHHHHHRVYHGLVVRMLVVLLAIKLSNADSPLTIGIIDGSYPYVAPSPHSIETMYRRHLERYSNNQVLGRPVEFVYQTVNGSFPMNTIMLRSATQTLIRKYSPDVILCPFQSSGCEEIATAAGVPAFVGAPSSGVTCRSDQPLSSQPPCQVVGTRRYTWAWAVTSSYDQYFNTFIGTLKIKGAKTLALVGDLSSSKAFIPGITLLTRDNHIEFKQFIYPTAILTPQVLQNFTQLVMSYNPDALIVTADCNDFVPLMQQLDYMPKALCALACDIPTLGDRYRYLVSTSTWDQRLIGSEYTETLNHPAPFYPVSTSPDDHLSSLPSPLQFANDFFSAFNRTPIWNELDPIASLQMWESAIRLANTTTDRIQIAAQLNGMYQPSFFGILSSNGMGVNQQMLPIMLQADLNNVQQLVAPLSTATADFIYPAPKWSERTYTFQMYAKNEEIALIAIVSIMCAGILVLMMALYRYREHPAVKATTPWISAVMGVGGITASLAILAWPLENNPTTCSARLWMWTLGFHLFIGPLLAKTFRIDRIFNQVLLQNGDKHISDGQVAIYAILPFIPQLIINIVWYALDTPQATLTVPDPIRPVFNYVDCASDYTYVLAPLSFFYSLLLLIIACYLAYRIRNAYKVFNDTKSIIQCIYIFAVTAIVIGAVQFTVSGQRPVLFIIRSIGVVIAYGVSLSILFLSRIRAALQTEADMKKSSLNSGRGVNSSMPQDRHDMLRYKAEVDKYKVRLTTLEQLLKENNIPFQSISDDNTTTKAKTGRSSSVGNGAVASVTGKRRSVVSTTACGPSENHPVLLSLTAAHTSPTQATHAMTETTVPLVGVEIAGTTGSETVEASSSLSPNRLSFSMVSPDKPRTVRIHTVPPSP